MRKFRISLHGEPEDVIVEADNFLVNDQHIGVFYNGALIALNDVIDQARTVFIGRDFIYIKDITNEKEN